MVLNRAICSREKRLSSKERVGGTVRRRAFYAVKNILVGLDTVRCRNPKSKVIVAVIFVGKKEEF